MKTINNKKKGIAMLITAAILTLVMLFAGCKHKTESKKSEPKYTITFGVDGTNGTLKAMVGGNEINTGDKVAQGKTVTFTATPNSGYKVKEWKVGNDVVTGNTSNTYTCTVTKAVTVQVKFQPIPPGEASYKVKHYKEKEEGGYPAEPTDTEDKNGTVGTNAAYTPKTGGAYEGFTYKSDLTKVNGTVQPSGTIKPDGSTVVELFYERNTVNVTFNLAGGNVAGNTDPIVKTGKYGTAFTAPADPVKTDAVFKGWNPSLPSPLLYPASNAEYTAQWQAVPKYTVTFGVEGTNGTLKAEVDGNEIHSGDKVKHGKTVTFTATPNSGYKVKEWKVGNDIVTGNTSNTYTCTVTKAVTVQVKFQPIPPGEASYKVKHYKEKAEGGYPTEPTETESLSGTVGTNAAYTPKTGGAYEGFTYKSGLTKINGTIQTSGPIQADGSTVVELYYERKTVNVTFKLAGGNVAGNTGPIVKTGKYGTAFTAPANPVKTDDIFEGWNPSLPSPLLYPASNAEYTAQWQAVPKYTVTFGVEGSNGTLKATVDGNEINTGDKVKQGKTVEFTAVPNAYYYVYQWTVNGGEFEAGTGIFGSTVAKVKITGNVTVSVSFNVETPLVEISSVIIPKAGTSYGGNKLPVKITGKNFKAYHVSQANFSGSGATFSNFNIVSDTFAMAEVECPSVVGDTTVTVTCKTASKTGVLSVKDYSTGYEVGKIVLADKSLVEKDSYTMVDHANPPVGVICGYTYGVPRMIALKKHYERLRWAEESTTGYSKKFEGLICNPSQTGDGAASTATFTGDIDGSDNWEYIKSIDPAGTADAATNYPAFNWVNEYNTTYASLLGGKSFAWYMPSLAELCEVYKNRIAINESYKKIRKLSYTYAPQELVFPYWSSSQYSNSSVYSDYDYAWYVFFKTGKLSSLLKNYYCSVCCLADFLNE